jgi:hypothetical protein
VRNLVLALTFVLLFGSGALQALPKLEEPVPLPADFTDIVTIYPDNTVAKAYWIVPSTARIVKKPDGTLSFGLVHSGISSYDPDGLSALLTLTVQPYIDEANLTKAKNLVAMQNPGATFSFISPIETTCRLLVGGQFVDWDGKSKTVIAGGTVEAGIPFQFKTTNNLDVRALSQGGGGDANTIGALFTMKYRGIGKKIHFKVVAKYDQTLTHFKAAVSGSGWFGLVKAKAKSEWTDFKDKPFVTYQVLEGTQEDVDKYMEKYGAQKLLNTLLEQLANRSGMFTKTVQPTNLPDAPGGGGILGWGVSVGGGFEKSTSTSDLEYEVNLNFTEDREISFGMTFPTSSTDLKPYVKNLTDTNKPFPTGEDYKKIAAQNGMCMKDNLKALKSLLDAGLLPQEVYIDMVKDAVTKGCHVKYVGADAESMGGLSLTGPPPANPKAPGALVPHSMIMELKMKRSALPPGQIPPDK